jgi:phenylpropionate dioxygenase-like ring-hydroxylating dioxygenase large terminal subunit
MSDFPSGWYAILHKNELKIGKPLAITRFGIDLVVWQEQNSNVAVMEDRCPHRSAKLSIGRVCNGKIRCPFHGFEFTSSGKCSFAPEFGKAIPKLKVKTFPAKILLDMVWIRFGEEFSMDIDFLTEIHEEFDAKYSITSKEWNSHITRCIENQLDYTHLPEVHYNTIGRNFVVPTNPQFKQIGNSIYSYHRNNTDEPGSIYVYPNSWVLNISNKLKLVVYFVPLSESKTKLYLLSYRKFLTNIFVNGLISWVMNIANKKILAQDQKIVESQVVYSDSRNELLMKHDGAIKIFRKMWNYKYNSPVT